MKRVAFVITTPTFGGPHNQALRLHNALIDLGWEQLIVTTNEPGDGASRLRNAGIPVRQIQLHRLRRGGLKSWISLYQVARSVPILTKVFKEENIQVVQFAGIQNLHIGLSARLIDLPVVCQLLSTYAPRWMRIVFSPLASEVIDIVMPVGLGVLKEHPGIIRNKQIVIPFLPPVDIQELDYNARSREQVRAELGIPSNGIVIVTLGNFVPQKSHEILVESAKLLCEQYSNVYIRILGSWVYDHEFYYQQNVIIKARVLKLFENDRLRIVEVGHQAYRYLAAGDVFVLSSIAEGIPTAMLEAMALGMPVVATAVGSVPEVLNQARAGILVPPRDPEKLAKAVSCLIEDTDLRKEFGQNGRRFVLESVDIRKCAALHAKAYELAVTRFRS